MMKSRPSLKNSARCVLLLNLPILACLIWGCSSPTTPTYLKEDIDKAIPDICKSEYNIYVNAKLAGSTLWIYLPLEDMFEKTDRPEKSVERFAIDYNKAEFKDGAIKAEYLIKPIQEQEKYNNFKYSKAAIDKINNVWKVLRRVLFSMKQSKKGGLQFCCLVTADIKNATEVNGVKYGFEIVETFYLEDLKKVSYQFISWGEYQHRTVQDTAISPQIIGDKEGAHLDYRDITLEEFILKQIEHRIKLKFQKPEVEKNADIDKEILKIATYTLKTYDFKDFSSVELNNLGNNNKTILNQAAVWARSTE